MSLGCPREELLDVLRLQVVSMVEQAVPYWGPLISKVESNMIERVLKTGLRIIFQSEYTSFQHALTSAGMKSLKTKRADMIFKFAKQSEQQGIFLSGLNQIRMLGLPGDHCQNTNQL